MTHTIFKYPFAIVDSFTQQLPLFSRILKVGYQRDKPTMWVLHSTSEQNVVTHTFRIYGTGHKIFDVDLLTYIGTLRAPYDGFVWHLFEETNEASNGNISIIHGETAHA
jgi:hypothetical protein